MLAELLVDEICAAKEMILDETILDADIAPRTGLVDLITEAFGAGIGDRGGEQRPARWVEPLVRQLVGEGIVNTVVTADDAPDGDVYRVALADLGAQAQDSLAFAGSAANQRKATAAGLATRTDRQRRHRRDPVRVRMPAVHDKWWDQQAVG